MNDKALLCKGYTKNGAPYVALKSALSLKGLKRDAQYLSFQF